MKVQRIVSLTGLTLVGALALSACGTDNNASSTDGTSSSGTATIECGTAPTINAEGSSAQKNAVEQAIASYEAQCPDVVINYNPTGSGSGIKQFTAAQVEFAGSDSTLKIDKGEVDAAAQRCTAEAWHLPMVTGPIAIAYNVDGVDRLVLDAVTTAKIFRGEITTWNDPAITALNPDANLPADPIHVFFRSDESGTTENFTNYLAAAAPGAWTEAPAKKWPDTAAGEGREKSSGVAEGVKTTTGAITYVEWSYAKDNKLGVARIDTGSGPVELSAESASKAVAAATPDGTGNDLRLKLDYATKAEGAYPIILVTYEIVCAKGLDSAKAATVKSFLGHFASPQVQDSLVDLGYAPLPAKVAGEVRSAIKALS